jgi:hypothetical protein
MGIFSVPFLALVLTALPQTTEQPTAAELPGVMTLNPRLGKEVV